MELMLAITLLLGAAVLGAWRLESEFDRETRPQPAHKKLHRAYHPGEQD